MPTTNPTLADLAATQDSLHPHERDGRNESPVIDKDGRCLVCSRDVADMRKEEIAELRQMLAAAEGELGKLAKFKAYVHKRLDDADVPNHPNPKTHDGCRIGARLDWCEANRKALINQINLLTHKVITCGVAASHPDAELTRRLKCYAEDWNSPQAEEVRALRAERDEIKQQLAVQDDAYKLLYDRVLDAQKLREENGRLRAALREIRDFQIEISSWSGVGIAKNMKSIARAALAAAPGPAATEVNNAK